MLSYEPTVTLPPPVTLKMLRQPPPELVTIQSCPVCTLGANELPGGTVPWGSPLPPAVMNQT